MTDFQKLLIASIFALSASLIYFGYKLTVTKPVTLTVAERCFNACEISEKLTECVLDVNKINQKGDASINYMVQREKNCSNACLVFCTKIPKPEYFKQSN